MNFALAVNTQAGSGRAMKIAREISQLLRINGHETSILTAPSVNMMKDNLESAAASGSYSAMVSIGGDGLAHLVINACAQSAMPVYVVPAGTGNDFARTNNPINRNPDFIVDRLLNEKPNAIDLGKISFQRGGERVSEWFGQVLSTGFDSLVNRRANRIKLVKGQMKYNVATLLELPLFKPLSYDVRIDGQLIATDAMLVAVANGPTYGGGMKVLPEADRHDGELDVMILKPVGKIELLKVFPRVFKGTHVSHPAVRILSGKRISLKAPALAYADGEFISELPIDIEVVPNALQTWEVA